MQSDTHKYSPFSWWITIASTSTKYKQQTHYVGLILSVMWPTRDYKDWIIGAFDLSSAFRFISQTVFYFNESFHCTSFEYIMCIVQLYNAILVDSSRKKL